MAVGDARLSESTASASSLSLESQYQPPTPRADVSRAGQYAVKRSASDGNHQFSPEHKDMFASFSPQVSQNALAANGHPSKSILHIENVGYTAPSNAVTSPSRSWSFSVTTPIGQSQSQQNSSGTDNVISSNSTYPTHQHITPSTLPLRQFASTAAPRTSRTAFAAAFSQSLGVLDAPSNTLYPTMGDSSAMNSTTAYQPVFGADRYSRSPFSMADDFTAWLFNENHSTTLGFTPAPIMTPTNVDTYAAQPQEPYFIQTPTLNGQSMDVDSQQTHPMSVTNVLKKTTPERYIMSEEKRQELLDLMSTQFNERPHDAVRKRKDAVFDGDINADGHVLGLRMMHTYIGSYWYHQHAQLPILHKPTFCADQAPNLLLLAVIAIGAATMDKAYGTSRTDSAAEFAHFVIWHIRWETIRDADFRPPAKLWIFQTLLLIETYEKMYATRALHERGHIHHDSTLTLMRRGSSLIGRSAFNSPPSWRDEKTGISSGSNSNTASDCGGSEESWTRWITNEATRRAAFAAFVIDSIHATMFGHSAKMVAHEMRLPLPCDEAMWSATSAAEVARVQSSLQTNGVKPTMFLDGLKRTLSGHRVRTNSFGRTILMAGLLSVSWHMNQRDLQISSLGAQSFGGREKWRGSLLRAFDNWKRDFDEALAEATPANDGTSSITHSFSLQPIDDENIFESRTVLHHLAHIASHVDIVDCQIFAGAGRLLGRSITPKDYSNTREKITERWAKRASARDAAFYALKFLAQVLIPPYEGNQYGHAASGVNILPQAFEQNQYMARDDFLLNRPWVLYFSTLVVWCYGFALEGQIVPPPKDDDFATPQQRDRDMRDYLHRVGGIRAPDDLENVSGRNRCLGLLMILKESFSLTRWELTHEAANLLGNCINKLRGIDGIIPSEIF